MPESPTFTFDPKTLRYRYTSGDKAGQFVSSQVINPQLFDQYLQQRKTALRTITDQLLNGQISVSGWEELIARELKTSHITAYSLGKGGTKRLSNRDYGTIGARVKGEYAYLRRFSQTILDGKLSEAQIQYRISLYIESLHSTYELARTNIAIESGKRWERWVRNKMAESCDGCIFEENKSWQVIGSLPRIGTKQCQTNCRCYKQFSDAIEKPVERLLSVGFGWL